MDLAEHQSLTPLTFGLAVAAISKPVLRKCPPNVRKGSAGGSSVSTMSRIGLFVRRAPARGAASVALIALLWGCGSGGDGRAGDGPQVPSPTPGALGPSPAPPQPTPAPMLSPAPPSPRPDPGSLDPTFGVGGIVSGPWPELFSVNSGELVVDRDGRIVVIGRVRVPDPTGAFDTSVVHTTLVRLEPGGSIDPSFGEDGVASPRIAKRFAECPGPGCVDRPRAAAVLADGRLLVSVGVFDQETVNNTSEVHRSALVVFESDGSLDRDFGQDGLLLLDFGDGPTFINDLVAQPDGGFLGVGALRNALPAAVRLDEAASIQREFGADGRLLVNFETDIGPRFWAGTNLPDGRVLAVGGGSILGAPVNNSATITPAGEWSDALADLDLWPVSGFNALRPSVDSKGRIVIAYREQFDETLARLSSDLRLDEDFGAGGAVRLNVIPSATFVQAGDSILVLGSFGGPQVAFARYDESGRLDRDFGDEGMVVADLTEWTGQSAALQSWVEQPDRKLLTTVGSGSGVVLARWIVSHD